MSCSGIPCGSGITININEGHIFRPNANLTSDKSINRCLKIKGAPYGAVACSEVNSINCCIYPGIIYTYWYDSEPAMDHVDRYQSLKHPST